MTRSEETKGTRKSQAAVTHTNRSMVVSDAEGAPQGPAGPYNVFHPSSRSRLIHDLFYS